MLHFCEEFLKKLLGRSSRKTNQCESNRVSKNYYNMVKIETAVFENVDKMSIFDHTRSFSNVWYQTIYNDLNIAIIQNKQIGFSKPNFKNGNKCIYVIYSKTCI